MKRIVLSISLLTLVAAVKAQRTVRFYLQDFGNTSLFRNSNDNLQRNYNGNGSNTSTNNQVGAPQHSSANSNTFSYSAIFNSGSRDGVTSLKANTEGVDYSSYNLVGPINGYVFDGSYAITQYIYNGEAPGASNPAVGNSATLDYAMPTWGGYTYDHTTGGEYGGELPGYNANSTASSTTNSMYPGLFMYINANPTRSGVENGSYFELPLSVLNIPGATYTASVWWRDMDGNNIYYKGQPGATDRTNAQPVPAFVGIDVNTGPKGSGTSLANIVNPAAQAPFQDNIRTTHYFAQNTPRHTAQNTGTSDKWHQLATTFTLDQNFSGNTVYFNVYNSDPGYGVTGGNDLAIDDVELSISTINKLTGKVYTNDGTTPYDGTNEDAPLYTALIDNNNKVIQSTQVGSDGVYEFTTDPSENRYVPYAEGNIGLKVILSTTELEVGDADAKPSLPEGVTSTGPDQSGIIEVTKTDEDDIELSTFYVNTPPVAEDVSVTETELSDFSLTDKAGYIGITTTKNPLSGSDTEDGTTKNFTIGQIGDNTLLFYDGEQLEAGDEIANYDPAKLTIYVSETSPAPASFTYYTTDEEGTVSTEDATYTVALPKVFKSLSGTVYGNDGNGDGTSSTPYDGTSETAPLYAVLTSASGTVLQSTQVGADGTFTFTSNDGFSYADNNLNILLSATRPADGAADITAASLPEGFSNTGHQYTGGSFISDHSGTLEVSSNDAYGIVVTLGHLYIENSPIVKDVTPSDLSADDYDQPGTAVGLGEGYSGITTELYPLNGTDDEDGQPAKYTIKSIGENTVLYYDGRRLEENDEIENYDPAKLVIYTSKNSSTAPSFTYTATDAAGVESNPATYSLVSLQVLPVSLLTASFKAKQIGNSIVLSWTTATEINNKGFQLERSSDNKNWHRLGNLINSQAANGNSSQSLSYRYTDAAPHNGLNYYRLIQEDLSGNTATSGVVSVNVSGSKTALTLYPNPVSQGAAVALTGVTPGALITVYNVNGRLVQQFTATSANQKIVTNALASGTYFVKVITDTGEDNGTFIVK